MPIHHVKTKDRDTILEKKDDPKDAVMAKFGMSLVAGASAGAVAKTSVAPLERIKVMMQVQEMLAKSHGKPQATTVNGIARYVFQTEGVTGFWRGNGTNLVRIIPNTAIKFACYDKFKQMVAQGKWNPDNSVKSKDMTVYQKLLAGGMSGGTTLVLTYPLDLARTRLTADSKGMYNGIIDCLRGTMAREGVGGLYKGMATSLVGVIPYIAISMTTYDVLKEKVLQPLVIRPPKNLRDNPDISNEEYEQERKSRPEYVLGKLAVGAVAGVFAQTSTFPLDTVRRRMQMGGCKNATVNYDGVLDCVRTMYRKEGGVGAFFRGVTVNVWKAAPSAALQFFLFDIFKSFMCQDRLLK